MGLVYDPGRCGPRLDIVCFISGSGTNYREIVVHNPHHRFLVFTNRPGCPGEAIARGFGHDIVRLTYERFAASLPSGKGPANRNSPARLAFEQEAVRRIESRLNRRPDLVCLAGYDLLNTDWMVDRYCGRMLNVHPGDITKGYTGLHWVPAAKAILAGEPALRSSLFFVDTGLDTGPILLQSAPLPVTSTLERLAGAEQPALISDFEEIKQAVRSLKSSSFPGFKASAPPVLLRKLENICLQLQNELKMAGDWKIYPFGVELIAEGRVGLEGREVYLDGRLLPEFGFRAEQT
jgi:folate-dependent phosphoribosylglycinamide formyltransferase PurN